MAEKMDLSTMDQLQRTVCLRFANVICVFIYANADEADVYMFYRCFFLFFCLFFVFCFFRPSKKYQTTVIGNG